MNSKSLKKIFKSEQIKEIDAFTIKNEPISSVDLMERAAMTIFNWIRGHYNSSRPVKVFAGTGNNGGDGLAVARMLAEEGFQVEVFFIRFINKISEDCRVNYERLKNQQIVNIKKVKSRNNFPVIDENDLVLDGIFGSGLTRPLSGLFADIVQHINSSNAEIIAIDIPSGLFGEDNSDNQAKNIVKARYTLTFQFPKLSFFFPDNEEYVGCWYVLPIGLHSGFISEVETSYFQVTSEFVSKNKIKRKKFSHKGTYGHVLLIAGCYGKMGAAILASRACLRSGTGLITTHIPRMGNNIIQTAVPEAMISLDQSDILFSQPPDLSEFSNVGIGPALGCRNNSQNGLFELMKKCNQPMVIDADAINILGQNKEWINKIPENSILTPHPKEFERLTEQLTNGFERLNKQIEFAVKYKLIVVLKGAYTSIACPDGTCYFNSTGNPGMATAGSGDVLTGIILSLLGQGYQPPLAAIMGVYVHGLAGDLAKEKMGEEALTATDIIDNLGNAFMITGK